MNTNLGVDTLVMESDLLAIVKLSLVCLDLQLDSVSLTFVECGLFDSLLVDVYSSRTSSRSASGTIFTRHASARWSNSVLNWMKPALSIYT